MNDKITAKFREYHQWLTSSAAGLAGAGASIDAYSSFVPAALLTMVDVVLEESENG